MAVFIKALIETFLMGLAAGAAVAAVAFIVLLLPVTLGAPVHLGKACLWLGGAAFALTWIWNLCDTFDYRDVK